jgi:hypothetical protein
MKSLNPSYTFVYKQVLNKKQKTMDVFGSLPHLRAVFLAHVWFAVACRGLAIVFQFIFDAKTRRNAANKLSTGGGMTFRGRNLTRLYASLCRFAVIDRCLSNTSA